jgi:serine/threonine-protein kinase
VLYECLTGSPPFDEDTMAQLVAAHLNTPPPQPSIAQSKVPEQFDQVIATGMAKNPDQRYATTVELARAAREATTVPLSGPGPSVPVYQLSRPDQRATGRFHGQDTQLAAPVPQPPGLPTSGAHARKPPGWRRSSVVISVLLGAIAALIAGGIFAAVNVSQHHNRTAAPPNTGPFTGTYTVDLDQDTTLDGRALKGTPATETWDVRSVCGSAGCVATAARRSGQTTHASTLVFDDVGGSWLAVGLGSSVCEKAPAPAETWEVITLQPHPDGSLSGEYSSTGNNACVFKRAVTFTRTGDVDVNSLPDPASQPPRVVSPAEALHGRYHLTSTTSATATTEQYDLTVRTDCLRTGDRCRSYFHGSLEMAFVFGSGKWTADYTFGDKCVPSLDATQVTLTGEYPLPQPPQDPITLLTGHSRTQKAAPCPESSDYDDKYVRTGD